MDVVRRPFHEAYERVYGFADEEAPVEIINLRVTIVGVTPNHDLPRSLLTAEARPARQSDRSSTAVTQVTASVYGREELGAGQRFPGPAIVEAADTTVYVPAGYAATVDEWQQPDRGRSELVKTDNVDAGDPPEQVEVDRRGDGCRHPPHRLHGLRQGDLRLRRLPRRPEWRGDGGADGHRRQPHGRAAGARGHSTPSATTKKATSGSRTIPTSPEACRRTSQTSGSGSRSSSTARSWVTASTSSTRRISAGRSPAASRPRATRSSRRGIRIPPMKLFRKEARTAMRLELFHPRPGTLARLSLGRGWPRRFQRRPPAAVLCRRPVERQGPDPQGAAVWPDQQRGQSRRGRQGILLLPR